LGGIKILRTPPLGRGGQREIRGKIMKRGKKLTHYPQKDKELHLGGKARN